MFNPDSLTPKDVPKVTSSSVDSESGIRPRKIPNSRKEFKNVLEGKESLTEEDIEALEEDFDAGAKKKALQGRSRSIFDLSADKTLGKKVKEELPLPKPSMQEPSIDPSLIIGSLPTNAKVMEEPKFAQEVGDLSSIGPNLSDLESINRPLDKPFSQVTRDRSSGEDSPSSSGMTKDSDSPLAAGIPPAPILNPIASIDKPIEAVAPVSMKELIDKLVDTIYTLQSAGKSETVITLKELGGAQVTITTFDTAKNEVNITFSKLTQQLETLMQQNRQSLESGLRNAGVVFHIVTFTTVDTVNIPTDTTGKQQSFTRDEDAGAGEQQKKKK